MIRLVNDKLSRYLHAALYDRLYKFCEEYAPEVVADPIVQGWLNRLYNDDMSLHILVGLDKQYNITEHMVIEVQRIQQTDMLSVHCYQAQGDKPNIDNVAEGVEYIDKLVLETGAVCSAIYVAKHSKALEKKYGYKAIRTVMIKYPNQDEE